LKSWSLLLALVLAAGSPAIAKTVAKPKAPVAKTQKAKLSIGKATLSVDIVDNDSLRTLGLSGRKSMDWNSGMLFVFPEAQRRTFWMIDCWFDLDIAYLDRRGTVRDIQTMRIEPGVSPERLSRYPSATDDIVYALEVNRGWMAANNVKVGDKIQSVSAFRARK